MDADSYLRVVLESAPEIASAGQAYKAAEASWRQAQAEAWLPTFSAEARGNPWGHNPLNGNRWNSLQLNADNITYSLGASFNLFNSFYDWRRITQARLSRDAAMAAFDSVRQALAVKALTSYLDLFLKQKLKQVADANREAQKAQYELTLDLYRHGMKSKSDLLKSETDWKSSQLRSFSQESERRKTLYRFNLLADRAAEAEAELPDLTQGATRFLSLDEALGQAAVQRPELRKSAAELRNSQLSAQGAAQNFLPKLAATLNWNQTRSASFGATAPATSDPSYVLGLTLSLPVGYTGASQALAYSAARAQARQAAFERAALLRSVRESIYNAHVELDLAFQSYRVGVERERSARESLEIVLAQYQQGASDVIRLAQVRADYLQAQIDSLTFLHDTQLRWLQYRHALGEPLWTP
jgi:outer membrane protein TolC